MSNQILAKPKNQFQNTIYMFIDESGNFDYSKKGTQYYVFTCLTLSRPFEFIEYCDEYKHRLLENKRDISRFHCAEDNRHVRKEVFGIIARNLNAFRFDSLVIEKSKCNPSIREIEIFYPKMFGYLLKYICSQNILRGSQRLVIITDKIPVPKNRKLIERGIKSTLVDVMPSNISYSIYHHQSASHYGLQLVDYGNWSIFRKWESEDTQFYDLIKPSIKSEFDIFSRGNTHYY